MKKGFTLMELLIVVVICGVLATFAIPTYQNLMDNSKAKVCYTNQLAVLKAVDIYTLENDKMPTSLSMLPAEYIQKAYAQILPKAGFDIKIAYWLVDREGLDMAYAQTQPGTAWLGRYLANLKVLRCPADTSVSTSISYVLDSASVVSNYTAFKALSATTAVIHDLSALHKSGAANYAIGVNSNGGRLTSPDAAGGFVLNATL